MVEVKLLFLVLVANKILCHNTAIKHDPPTGAIVRLADETVWRVNEKFIDTSRSWKQDEPIEVCGNKLTNLNRDEHIWAVRTQ